MKKAAAIILLVCSGYANAKILPIDTLQALYEVYAKLNTCHHFGYIDNDVLSSLDKVIQNNKYQDNVGNVSNLTQDNIDYYHSLHDRQILDLQAYSNNPEQSGSRPNIKILCDQLNTSTGSSLGIQAHIIPPDQLPTSARPILNEENGSSIQTPPEESPIEWESSPVEGATILANSEQFYLDKAPDGLEVLNEPGLYIRSSVNSENLYQIDGLYELYKPKPAPGTDEILNHPFYGCGGMLQEAVEVADVTSGGNRNTVLDFKVRHDDGATTAIPFNTWASAMNQLQKNSASSLIAQGKHLRIYYQLCGNGGFETIRGIEKI
ncbi:hypothetical protein [Aeromonas bestiarum]|uniref:hypothetical protein n=1 Tax=Aeromonas bestiarum TaxID=105751 RepID=UPI001AE039D6|nr:hypothetical protein [Aeromonas bestiarum]